MRSRFAALRVRPAHRDYWRKEPHPDQWLLIEWPKTEAGPTKYWLSNLPASIALGKLVAIAKLRWRIERDYEELKQELSLGHSRRELARILSSCNLVDSSLRLPGNGTMPFSPQLMCGHSRRPTSRFAYHLCNRPQDQRRYPSKQNGITLNPLPLCDG
jgi:hypothetical protein